MHGVCMASSRTSATMPGPWCRVSSVCTFAPVLSWPCHAAHVHDATSRQPYFGHLRLFYPQIRFISIFISVKSHDHGPEHDRPPWSSSVNLETHGRLAAISVKSRLHARPPCHQSAPFLNPGSFTMCGKFRWIVMSLPFRLHGLPHVHSPIFKCF